MSYQANEPGTELTSDEQMVLSQLADLGTPHQILEVNDSGTGIDWIDNTGSSGGDILTSTLYDINAIGGILLGSQYSII